MVMNVCRIEKTRSLCHKLHKLADKKWRCGVNFIFYYFFFISALRAMNFNAYFYATCNTEPCLTGCNLTFIEYWHALHDYCMCKRNNPLYYFNILSAIDVHWIGKGVVKTERKWIDAGSLEKNSLYR